MARNKKQEGNMKGFVKRKVVILALGASFIVGNNISFAGESKDEYVFDPIIVTAQRCSKTDMDTPAAVTVYSAEQLKLTGANSVIEALKYSEGIIYHAQGPLGNSQGAMTSKLIIRGVEKGTLVLIDGVPLNLHGRYNLEDISLNDIEKIEIVRGGGAVLYGSEAMGGVINIIMKERKNNTVSFAGGNYGSKTANMSLQAGKLGVALNVDKTEDIEGISGGYTRSTVAKTSVKYVPKRYYDFSGNDKNGISWDYKFNDNLNLAHQYSTSKATYYYRHSENANNATIGSLSSSTKYDTDYNRLQLKYSNNDLVAKLYLNEKKQDSDKIDYWASTGGKYQKLVSPTTSKNKSKDKVVGLDLQNSWILGSDTLLLGADYKRESYADISILPSSDERSFARNIYSVYGQYNHELDEKSSIIFSARETLTTGATDDKNYQCFTPQLQYLKEIDVESSFYASAAKSFMMPTFTQIYGSTGRLKGNSAVRPQEGKHFEVGVKKNHNNHAWRVALFNYYIKDNISSTYKEATDEFETSNEDIKNTGLEFGCEIENSARVHTAWGLSYSNPQKKETDKNGVSSAWRNYYGRLQLNGGVTYSVTDWKISLNATYLAKRERDTDTGGKIKPMLLTNLNINHNLSDDKEIFLTIDNIFDRKDITSHASSEYYTMGRSFKLGYKTKL